MTLRTHNCGELRTDHLDQEVSLAGWVNSYRDHGGVIFIDLRDREGVTQIVFHPEFKEAHDKANLLRNEDVVSVTGKVRERIGPDGKPAHNPKLATGEVEVDGTAVHVLNKAEQPLPFTPDEAGKVSEEIRLRHRYIDLRASRMQNILRTRHRACKIMRDYFDENGFYEVETPFLCKSTPEGARDFLVPSRHQIGSFYALPQSPQLLKQLLMVAGIERYVQIVRCFRDEDPRADRQAEFTQVDLEMSFADSKDVMDIMEGAVRRIWKQILDIDVPAIPHMTYEEAMRRFGSDRPDLRFGMELVDIGDLARHTDFKVFKDALDGGGSVKCICVPGGGEMTRKETDALADWAKGFGAKGLAVTKVTSDASVETGIAKFLTVVQGAIIGRTNAQPGDLLCFAADRTDLVNKVLGELRIKVAQERGMIDESEWKWLWVVDFPLVEWDEEANRFNSLHHPFTAPVEEDLEKIETDPGNIRSQAYDLVVNGSEIAGGSIRIHQPDVQRKVFGLLGIDEEEAQLKFGFLLNALKQGAPPHGGIAMGLDRCIMHLVGTTNIRDVIAFPKTQNGADLLMEAPSPVDDAQLTELQIRTGPFAAGMAAAPAAAAADETPDKLAAMRERVGKSVEF